MVIPNRMEAKARKRDMKSPQKANGDLKCLKAPILETMKLLHKLAKTVYLMKISTM